MKVHILESLKSHEGSTCVNPWIGILRSNAQNKRVQKLDTYNLGGHTPR